MRLDNKAPKCCRFVPPKPIGDNQEQRVEKKKKKGVACTVCIAYEDILQMDFLSDGELVVVEQPWLDVEATLPDALERHVYGT